MRRSWVLFLGVFAGCALPEEQLAPVALPAQSPPSSLESQKSQESQPTTKEITSAPMHKEAAMIEPAFVEALLKIGKEYESYGRTDDFYHWAPGLCAAPPPLYRPGAYVSESEDDETHGRKIYSLLAGFYPPPAPKAPTKITFEQGLYLPGSEGQKAYLAIAKGAEVPEGLVLVKEAWVPEEVTDPKEIAKIKQQRLSKESELLFNPNPGHTFWPYAEKGKKLYQAKEKSALFVMYKTKEGTPNTDQGWVYGTLSADGKEVTSAGMLKKCMGCHTRAPYGRLFIDKKGNGE